MNVTKAQVIQVIVMTFEDMITMQEYMRGEIDLEEVSRRTREQLKQMGISDEQD